MSRVRLGRFGLRMAIVRKKSDTPSVKPSQLVDSSGRAVIYLQADQAAADVQNVNGIPVQKVISTGGTALPGNTASLDAEITTGSRKNLCPDSDIKFGTTYWSLGGLSITSGAGIVGGNGMTYTGTGGASGGQYALSAIIDVNPGQTITISASVDATYCSINAPAISVWKPDLSVMYAAAYAVIGAEERLSATFVVPAGVTQLVMKVGTNNSTVAAGKNVIFSNFQVEIGSTPSTYKANLADDSTGYLKAGSAAIDLSSGIHLNKNLDNIADGVTFARLLSNQIANNVIKHSGMVGKNACPNPGFEQNYMGVTGYNIDAVVGQTGPIIDGWYVRQNDNNTFRFGLCNNGSFVHGGSFSLAIHLPRGTTVPANTAYYGEAASYPLLVKAGEVVSAGAFAQWYRDATGAFPAGLTGFVDTELLAFDGNGNFISQVQAANNITIPTNGIAWQAQTLNFTMPANAAYCQLVVYASVTNTSGGPLTTSATVDSMEVTFDDCYVYLSDPTISGSGVKLGDQRNNPNSLTGNLGLVRSATALTAHAGGSVDGNAHTITMGAFSTSYNGQTSAITGLSTGVSYYISSSDNFAGGSPALSATTSSATVNSNDSAYLWGMVTIPSSGTGGGGGAGGCVTADMWLRDGLTARMLAEGWRWWHWLFPPKLDGKDGFRHAVRRKPRIFKAPTCRVITRNGCTFECSVDTPIDTLGGESIEAAYAYHRIIATDLGWSKVTEVELLGTQDCVRISLGGFSFYSGSDPHRRVDSHNYVKP